MKVALIGRIANGKNLYDGQTVKTRNLEQLLKDIKSIDSLVVVDTYNYKKRAFIIVWKTLKAVIRCNKVVLSLSINGRRFFFPFIYFLNKLFKKEIYHSLIGGRLVADIERYPKWKKYVSSFMANWVETKELVDALNKIDVKNAVYFPNFKYINDYTIDDEFKDDIVHFCTFSRVQKRKGISDAIEAVSSINQKYESTVAFLDIYGPIDEEYREEFENLCKRYNKYVKYCGCIDNADSVSVIKKYHALIFATHYFNEGIPGTIIDSLSAGVPVISRKWHYCDEIIDNNITGFIYEFDAPNKLVNAIDLVVNNPELVKKMRSYCYEKSKEYTPENAKNIILGSMRLK